MKLNIYILRQLMLAFLFSAAGMIFIAMPGVAVGAVQKLGGAGMLSVLKLMPMMVGVFVPYVLPVALLLALVSTYGRLAAQNEWTAIRMSGANPYSMLVPALLLALIAGGGVYILNAEVLPRLKMASKTIIIAQLKEEGLKNLARGTTEIDIADFHLSAEYRDPDDHQTFYDCYIEVPPESESELEMPRSFTAEAVRFAFTDSNMVVTIYKANGTESDLEAYIEQASFVVSLDKITGGGGSHNFKDSRYLTVSQLEEGLERIDREKCVLPYALIGMGLFPKQRLLHLWDRPRNRLQFAWHQNLANAATCLMFVLVGVSTGLLLRKGTQLTALGAAVGYAMVYWMASLRLGKPLVREGVLEPWVGAWAPLACFTIVGLWLTHRAFRE